MRSTFTNDTSVESLRYYQDMLYQPQINATGQECGCYIVTFPQKEPKQSSDHALMAKKATITHITKNNQRKQSGPPKFVVFIKNGTDQKLSSNKHE